MNPFDRDLSKYEAEVKERALVALQEDLGGGDITTALLFPGTLKGTAAVIAESDCVLAGVLEARAIFEDAGLCVSASKDGEEIKKESRVMKISGDIRSVLSRERTALNYLSRMSGIATMSRMLYNQHGPRVLFPRKVDPGLLLSEKRAVALGGCLPHRLNLSDGVLIKDNHLAALRSSTKDPIREAIRRASQGALRGTIEIEVETVEEGIRAAEEFSKLQIRGIILADNMEVGAIGRLSRAVKGIDPSILIEASGGIGEGDIKRYLKAGADYVSTSIFLTAPPCSFTLEVL